MFDLGKQSVTVECPKCRFANRITLKQARIHDVVICRGCKGNIQLEDHMETVKKTIRDLGRAVRDLQDQLAAIGKIEIRL
jgi:transposase-like protein